jgi:hypothetical protein
MNCKNAKIGPKMAILTRRHRASFFFAESPPVVNFINSLCAHFSYETALQGFSLVMFWLW